MPGAALLIASSILLSRILGIAREILLARISGTGAQKSALDLAFMIPDILNHLVSTGFLSMIFIPLFTGYLVRREEEKAWNLFANILNVLGFILLSLMIPAWWFIRELLLLLTAANPEPEVLDLAVRYGRILLPAQIAFFAGSFLVALQHTRKQFFWPSLTGIIYNTAIILGGWLGRHRGLEGFAWGVPVGAFTGFLFLQLWAARRNGGIRWKPVFCISDPDLRRYLELMLPLIGGVGAMFALEFAIRSFGSGFGTHGIAALNYAYRLMYTLVAVFGFSVGVASFPEMARLVKEGQHRELNRRVGNVLGQMFSVLVPTILAVWFFAFPIVRILFERGAFSRSSTELVAHLLRWYLPTTLGLCAQAMLVRSFYARERMWAPTLINTLLFAVSLFFYAPTTHLIGIRAVPLIGAITAISQVLGLYAVWKKDYGRFGDFGALNASLRSGMLTITLMTPLLMWADLHWGHFWRSLSLPETLTLCGLGAPLLFACAAILEFFMGNPVLPTIIESKINTLKRRLSSGKAR